MPSSGPLPEELVVEGSDGGHVVHFRGGVFPADTVAAFLAGSPRPAEPGSMLAIARQEHLQAIERALSSHGVDVEAARRADRLRLLDARDVVAGLGGGPIDARRFAAVVGDTVDRMLDEGRTTRIYGEILDLFCEAGDLPTGLQVESFWNQRIARRPFTLLCGSGTRHVDRLGTSGVRDICAVHDHAVAEGTALERTVLESERLARRRALATVWHMTQLQHIIASLLEAGTSRAVARVATREMSPLVGADVGILALAEGKNLDILGLGAKGGEVVRIARCPVDAPGPVTECLGDRTPRWIESAAGATWATDLCALACLPLLVGDLPLGVLVFGYRRPTAFDEDARARLVDLARKAAMALDRARLYETAERERRRAEAANQAKDEFLAMLGHELRNPLAPIDTALELMRLRAGDVCAKERETIERQVRHMARLVSDLMDVSRISRGMLVLDTRDVELAEVVESAIETASPLLEAHAHELETAVPRQGLLVRGDPGRLGQAVANLLINAARYTPPRGRIAIVAEAAGSWVRLAVRDNGAGIDPALLPRLFELFTQGPRGAERREGGLGLGLAIVRAVVDLHGGVVHVRSDGPGRGSEFVIELPGRVGDASRREATPVAPTPAIRPRRILVVDDNVDAAEALREYLRVVGHHAEMAHDGPSALAAAPDFQPEVVLLDIGLPVMDGYEVADRLRTILTAPPRVIAVSGYGLDADRQRSAAAGFDAHLVKPIDVRALPDLIQRLGDD